jgi:hypothetical protein
MTEPTPEARQDALATSEAAQVTVVMPQPEKVADNKLVKIGVIVAILVAIVLFNLGNIIDLSFPRTVDVRSYGWSVASEGTTSKQLLSDEGTPRGDFYLTALIPSGRQITGRVDQSLPRYFTQRKVTFGNLKSSAAVADEKGCRVISLKISGVTVSLPFFKTYPVIKDVVVSNNC